MYELFSLARFLYEDTISFYQKYMPSTKLEMSMYLMRYQFATTIKSYSAAFYVKPHQFLGIHREKMLATIMLFKY
jgi:hypothetical protein